ncbi:hypothetical protein AAC691_06060 [Nguyenibacter vanlangensis]|uniref:Uncharacterized protein n=1 Tax=Nguyenibacter vanlangensis TaxID=1216886 RepID=A0ABZ3D8N3_9PROT
MTEHCPRAHCLPARAAAVRPPAWTGRRTAVLSPIRWMDRAGIAACLAAACWLAHLAWTGRMGLNSLADATATLFAF